MEKETSKTSIIHLLRAMRKDLIVAVELCSFKDGKTKISGPKYWTPANGPIQPSVQAILNIKVAQHWIGKLIGLLPDADKNPYPDSKTPGQGGIEPLADAPEEKDYSTLRTEFLKFNEIDQCKELRRLLTNFAEYLDSDTYQQYVPANRLTAICRTEIYTNLVQANHWFGEQLGAIRDANLKQESDV